MKLIPFILVMVFLVGSTFTSCKKNPVGPKPCDTCSKPCDTCKKPCDTCSINQDSLQKIKDSLAHAFIWTIHTIPGIPAATGVSTFGSNDFIVVAYNLYHFDGSNFTDMHPIRNVSNTPLDGAISDFTIFSLSKTDFWLVYPSGGNIALHTTDGKYFDDYRPGLINTCWGLSSSDMFFVGNSGNILHYNGLKFDTMTSNTTKDLRSVWGTSHNDVWACGYNDSKGQTVLLHYDGNSWQEDPISIQNNSITGGFDGVWCCDSSGHKVAITSGALMIHKTDNGIWRVDSALMPLNSLGGGNYVGVGPAGNTATDMFAIGPWGFVAHWNGKTWKKYNELFDYSQSDFGIYSFSIIGNTACAAGRKNGASWVAIGQRKQ